MNILQNHLETERVPLGESNATPRQQFSTSIRSRRSAEKLATAFGLTMEQVQASDCQNILPEWGDHQTVRRIFSIKRGKLYDLTNRGLVKAVSLRRPGQKFSKRLWYLQSVRVYLTSLLQAQTKGYKAD